MTENKPIHHADLLICSSSRDCRGKTINDPLFAMRFRWTSSHGEVIIEHVVGSPLGITTLIRSHYPSNWDDRVA